MICEGFQDDPSLVISFSSPGSLCLWGQGPFRGICEKGCERGTGPFEGGGQTVRQTVDCTKAQTHVSESALSDQSK